MNLLLRRTLLSVAFLSLIAVGVGLVNGAFSVNGTEGAKNSHRDPTDNVPVPASSSETSYSKAYTGQTSLSDTLVKDLRSIGFQLVEPKDPVNFSLPDPSGNTISVKQHRESVIVMNFWATWCPPCKEEMPSMQRLWEEYQGDGLTVLALNMRENSTSVKTFIDDFDLTFPIRIDNGRIANRMQVTTLPTTWLVGPKGKTIAKLVGPIDWDSSNVRTTLEKLMEETGAMDA